MNDDISNIDFDIALIGAGAYAFPLGGEIKKRGKTAILTCGQTPLIFGIYGNRHKDCPYKNDYWIRPMEEPPKRYMEVENGCYW